MENEKRIEMENTNFTSMPTPSTSMPSTYGLGPNDRRFSFSRQQSFRQFDPSTPIPLGRNASFSSSFSPSQPLLSRSDSTINVPFVVRELEWKGAIKRGEKEGKGEVNGVNGKMISFFLMLFMALFRSVRSGSRPKRRLAFMILLNAAFSTVELMIGVITGRFGLISDAFHLTFGCGLLMFSLLAMSLSQGKPDGAYTYGYKRLEVLSAFTNALFLLFMSFSLAVEALRAFIQDESEHKHYLIVSAVTNLLANILGFWFFRSYARVNLVYRKPEDMNYHSVCLHVLADSIRSAGIILASWLLTLGIENAEALCLGLVSATIFFVVLPLFRATGSILLQRSPASIPSSAFVKCCRQIDALEDVNEVSDARFWELVPGHVVGSLSLKIKEGSDDYKILDYVHGLYSELGIQELTVETS